MRAQRTFGWRALVHTPTGAMWNRHGQRLTIEREFEAALDILRPLAARGLVWADCEALERRHQIGRGSLVVLDWIPESGSPTYEERREFLAGLVETEHLSTGECNRSPRTPCSCHRQSEMMGMRCRIFTPA